MKKKQLCSSCRPSSAGKCRNHGGADSGAGPPSMLGPALTVSTCVPVSSPTRSSCVSLGVSSVDIDADGISSTPGPSRDHIRPSEDSSAVSSSVLVDLPPPLHCLLCLKSLVCRFLLFVMSPKEFGIFGRVFYRMLFG